jgi:hypothetical protein
LSNKWRIFHRPLNVEVNVAIDIVKACCILHNYVRRRDGYQFEDTLCIHGFENLDNIDDNIQGGNMGNRNRNTWADYFVSDLGKLPWQDKFI